VVPVVIIGKGRARVSGLVIDDAGFEILSGSERIGPRRLVTDADVALLTGFAARYVDAVQARSGDVVFLGIGRDLYRWLDGDHGQLSTVLEVADRPLVFEVRSVRRTPSDRVWAVLRAPFELLAGPDGGFLAQDALSRFCVTRRLGPPAPPPPHDDYRLGLAFMASSPRDQHELDYEAEESAILTAVGEHSIDLVVDDTGDPGQLAHRLAELGGLPAVHLSCHGLNSWRERPGAAPAPVLMMEDDAGAPRPTTAPDLARLLPSAVRPRLLFVSACLTATAADASGHLPPSSGHKDGDDGEGAGPAPGASGGAGGLVAHSLATALVSAGLPAVIGWDGSVGDRAATRFAAEMYPALADRSDLAVAVGDARRALLSSGDGDVRADWHLARLWLGPSGGGPLVAGKLKRSLIPATHGTKTFLDRKSQVPVASAEMFVGRRPQLQSTLRALRSGSRAGVLLHGQGRLGKSSLAARVADRCARDYAVAVVFGDYSALGILDAVAAAVRTSEPALRLIDELLPEVRQRPEAIEQVLVRLLSGPCAQQGPGFLRPLLLVIDDLEQVLVADQAGPHRVAPPFAPVLAAVLRAFDPAETDSRLLVTSRFTFTLDGLETRLDGVQLPPLSEVARYKLQRRQQGITSPRLQAERAALAARALAVSRGNPGLQDLIGLRLVYGEDVSPDRAEAVVSGMEAYLRQGDLPADADVRAFLENLALDALLAEAGEAGRSLLRATTVFTLPVPEPVLASLAAVVGGSPFRLRALGLLDPYPDRYDPGRLALAASPLAVGRLSPLAASERAALAREITAPLFAAWGGPDPESSREQALSLQLTVLALLADDPAVIASCARGAVAALRDGPARDAFDLGRQAVETLSRHGLPAPVGLLRDVADAAFTAGHGEAGEDLLNRAVRQAESGDQEPGPLELARVTYAQAVRLIVRGDLARAEPLLDRARQLFTAAGSDKEAAVTWGRIGDIAEARGELDEALRIRREVELPVYERLGDVREVAVTWGRIGDIAEARGELDEALRIRREVELPVYERLRDMRSIAAVKWNMAQVGLARGDYGSAVPQVIDSFGILSQMQDAQGVAVVGSVLGQLLIRLGATDEARDVLGMSLAAAAKLGMGDRVGEIGELLNSLPDTEEGR
jgi:tetratricopeptide (TPR) repeat protein